MDWRARKYYVATFSPEAKDMRIRHLKLIGNGVTIHFNSGVPKQPDEVEERGSYLCVIRCKYDQAETVEYELRKAERRDDFCSWKEIKQNFSKKYFDCQIEAACISGEKMGTKSGKYKTGDEK